MTIDRRRFMTAAAAGLGSQLVSTSRDAIAQTNIMTFYGPIRFNERGQNVAKGMSVVQIQNGKPVVVYPVAGAQGKFVYPIPHR